METRRRIRSAPIRSIGLLAILAGTLSAQPAPGWPPGIGIWHLSSGPVLRIGEEGVAETEFLRVSGVTRMPSGEIVVANTATAELRVFSARGAFIKALSRRGQGPGELSNPFTLMREGDTLFVVESGPGSNVLHIFSVTDGFRRRLPLRSTAAPKGLSVLARLSTGEFLVAEGNFRRVQPVTGVVERDTTRLGLLPLADQNQIAWLGHFPNNSWLGYPSPSLPSGVGYSRFMLGPSLATAASGDRAWIGDTGTGEIHLFDGSGNRVGRVTTPIRPRPFSDEAVEKAKRHALATAPDSDRVARAEAFHARSVRPRTAPLFTRFIRGVEGEMAIEVFDESPVAEKRLIVFSHAGRPLAGLVVPQGVTLHELGTDYAIGVHVDGDGIERVVQYRLDRSSK